MVPTRPNEAVDYLNLPLCGVRHMSSKSVSRRAPSQRSAAGFTMIELMVVIVIIGLLAAIAVPSVMDRISQGKRNSAKAQIKNFETALKLFRMDNDVYPDSLLDLANRPGYAKKWPSTGSYIEQIPLDPWGAEFTYHKPGQNNAPYDIISYAADNMEGGEGDGADITNHTLDKD